MIKKYSPILLLIVIFSASVYGSISSQQKKADHTIRVGFLGSADGEDYDGALVFKDYIESRTNGSVAVQIFPSGQFCGNERECIEATQSGILDVHMTTTGGLGRLFGPAQVFDLPYAFEDDVIAECVFDGPLSVDLRAAIIEENLGMRLMVVSNTGGWRSIATTSKLVREPADLAGLKIRTIPSAIQQELVRQLGGNPTPIAWPEVYSALATDVVEGTKNSIQDIVSAKLHENLKYITLDGHAYMTAFWWYSEGAWQQLPKDMKKIVFEAFQHLKTVSRAMPIRRQISDYDDFKKSGGTIYVPTPAEKMKFRQATSGMRDWFVEQYGAEWLEKLDTAISVCEHSKTTSFDQVDG